MPQRKRFGPPCSYRLRRVKRHVTLLSVHRFVHGLLLLQRSSLHLLLILLANDVELNPGPVISAGHLEHCSSVCTPFCLPLRTVPALLDCFLPTLKRGSTLLIIMSYNMRVGKSRCTSCHSEVNQSFS
jgi:hypothetical protein